MSIPVFVSCPSTLTEQQEQVRRLLRIELEHLRLEPRTLGRSDYPINNPLKEVKVLAKHCSGGVILGFSQVLVTSGILKPDTEQQKEIQNRRLASPWNDLEAGILFALGIPLLVFCEDGVSGGVFDLGTGDLFIHSMPGASPSEETLDGVKGILLRWYGQVQQHYYRD